MPWQPLARGPYVTRASCMRTLLLAWRTIYDLQAEFCIKSNNYESHFLHCLIFWVQARIYALELLNMFMRIAYNKFNYFVFFSIADLR